MTNLKKKIRQHLASNREGVCFPPNRRCASRIPNASRGRSATRRSLRSASHTCFAQFTAVYWCVCVCIYMLSKQQADRHFVAVAIPPQFRSGHLYSLSFHFNHNGMVTNRFTFIRLDFFFSFLFFYFFFFSYAFVFNYTH